MDSAQFVQGILESLGWAILHSFWQMALLWLAFQLFVATQRRLTPHIRHHAALLAMLIGTGWFIATFVHQYSQYVEIGRYLAMVPDVEPEVGIVQASGLSFSGIIQALSAFTAGHIAWLSTIYLCLLALMGWKLLQGCLQIHTLRSRGLVPAGPDLQNKVEQLARRLSIQVPVHVYLSRLVDVPATLGMLKPVVLLPVSCVTQLSPVQLESILLHELAHIRRMDYLVNLAVGLMETLLLHNPFAWWFARSIRREREWCCDDIVLAQRQDALEYASALLCLEQQRRLPQAAMAMASNGQQGQLLQRIRRITARPAASIAQPQRLIAVGLMGLLMLFMAWMRPTDLRAGTLDAKVSAVEVSRVILLQPPRDLTRPNGETGKLTERDNRNNRGPAQAFGAGAPVTDEPEMDTRQLPPASSRYIFINEAAPKTFTFTYDSPEEADEMIIVPEIHGTVPNAPVWVPETPRRRNAAPGIQERVGKDQKAMSKQQEEIERVVRAELEREKALKAFGWEGLHNRPGQDGQPAPQAVSPQIFLPLEPLRLDMERAFEGHAIDGQAFLDLFREHNQADALKRVRMPRTATKASVKVNRIKTRDGYTLRIVTEKESIDIRIGEDDIIVEKD